MPRVRPAGLRRGRGDGGEGHGLRPGEGLRRRSLDLRGLAGLYEDNLFLSNFYRFLDLKPAIKSPAEPVAVPDMGSRGLAFHKVSFTYPGSSRPAFEPSICGS